jgi:hypothetical protein
VAVVVVMILGGLMFWFQRKRSDVEDEDVCSSDPNIFLCHHKAGAGGFARLLKLMLLERNVSDIFLDR